MAFCLKNKINYRPPLPLPHCMFGSVMGEMGEEEEAEKWVNNCYSSSHQILLVGEGDFSFSLSLAQSFASAFNIVATSLDSYDTLTKKYKRAKSNLEQLEKLGASLIHEVDATKMKLHTDLKMRKFDRIVFNFPHAGFHGKEDNLQLIKKHRMLVHGFFRNAKCMLRPNGEIHVSHKTTRPFCHWNIEELASQNSLSLMECVAFKIEQYPGYNNKRGDSMRCDEPFHLGECSTFKFILSGASKKNSHSHGRMNYHKIQPPYMVNQSKTFGINYPPPREPPEHHLVNHHLSGYMGSPADNGIKEECLWIFDWYFSHVAERFGLAEDNIVCNVRESISRGYERFVGKGGGRPSGDFIVYLKEVHRLSTLRIKWLEQNLERWFPDQS